MAVDVEEKTYIWIPIEKLVSKSPIRKKSEHGVKRIQESMRWAGFLENYPLTVIPLEDDTFDVVDGDHRLEAARREGITLIPCIVRESLSDLERYQIAMQSNNAAETVVPSTLVTYAEFMVHPTFW